MIRLRILDILKEQNHSKYWLFKQMDLSYQNFNRMVQNETTSIKFENIEKLCKIIYVFLTIFLYLLKCPQSLIL